MTRTHPLRILALAAACAPLLLGAAPAVAEGGGFTFKRVAPPAAGATRRITVQIGGDAARPNRPGRLPQITAPAAPRTATVPAAPPSAPARAPAKAAAWFWNDVSPALPGRPGRFTKAAQRAANAPAASGVVAPSLDRLRRMASAHGATILRHSVGTRVSPALALAVISVESAGRSDAVSHAGATGLMQLMPATAERFGVTNRRDPSENIRGGVAYLDWLLKEFDGDAVLALAGYNAGEGAVRRNGGVPPYDETRHYVPKVMAAWSVARLMCATPPDLPSDGCVFAKDLRVAGSRN